MKGYNDERLHFDNKFNYTDLKIAWNTISAFIKPLSIYKKEDAYQLGKYLHAKMDFYAHSNYVELYISYWNASGKDLSLLNYIDSPPIYEDAIKEPVFSSNYTKYLITGHFNTANWLNPFVSDQELANIEGHIHHDLLNKDAPGKGRSDLQVIGTTSTLYHYARSCAVRNTLKIINEKK